MENPYVKLDASKFWKTGTSSLAQISNQLWCPKFDIPKDIPILTIGSCFAQHISNALVADGFNWLNAEPAPENLDPKKAKENGYGIFSFRVGNVYSVRLLRQWIEWAYGIKEESKEIFCDGGRYYDPFRPQIPPEGYGTEEEVHEARRVTYAAMRRGFDEAKLFIFTLGLTEIWEDSDGNCYPTCPGTLRGDFSPQRHHFNNLSYSDIKDDLEWVFSFLKTTNKQMDFLLTVSPVPLTATASEDHVLVATTYSKSVLRAVAGDVTKKYSYVDYFPSYEIIASHPLRSIFYEENLRSVKSAGVAFVMENFRAGFSKKRHSPGVTLTESMTSDVAEANVVCEDIILENWNSALSGKSQAAAKVLLVGDSHMGKLAGALDEEGIGYTGGGITDGSVFHSCKLALDAKKVFLLDDLVGRQRWQTTLEALDLDFGDGEMISDIALVTNIGMHSHMFIEGGGFIRYLSTVYGEVPKVVSSDDVNKYIAIARAPLFKILEAFRAKFEHVIFVTDPPVHTLNIEIHTMLEAALRQNIELLGIKVFDSRNWIRQSYGLLPSEFLGEDAIHGSSAYYKSLALELLRLAMPTGDAAGMAG